MSPVRLIWRSPFFHRAPPRWANRVGPAAFPGWHSLVPGVRKHGVFGFIAAPCPRCSGGSFPAWRGVFCGLSRCLAREYGQAARMLVNRDAAFIGLLGISLDPGEVRWREETCCNPLARPFPVADDHPAVVHAAAASVCGLAAKLADDARDEGFFRRHAARIAGVVTGSAADRAVAILNSGSFPTAEVVDCLANQESLEVAEPLRADEPTAAAYGMIVSHLAVLLDVPAQRDRLHRAGVALGSLVYWRDAWQDRREDARRGRFNPFACLDEGEIRPRVSSAWSGFGGAIREMGFQRHAELIDGVREATGKSRSPFLNLMSADSTSVDGSGRKGRERRQESSWWDRCDCCHCCDCGSAARPRKGGCCDCGPGDSGCCDCNPCDGCPCN